MALAIRYLGWSKWSDSGGPYRKWRFEKDAEDLGTVSGDLLYDRGPEEEEEGDRRLQVRDASKKHKKWLTLEEVEGFLGYSLPPWLPPLECEMDKLKSLDTIADALKDVARAIRSGSVVAGLGTTSSPKKSTNASGKSNKYLRLKGNHEYDNGDPYTDFELLVDVPEIPVTRVDGLDPMHAAKGDVLRERYDDELTPFQLRRNGRRIGDPEWWQLRHLFHGLKNWEPDPEKGGNSENDRPPSDLKRLHRLSPDEPTRRTHVLRATRSIPGTIVQEGDFLTFSTGREQRKDPDVQGAVALRVPRAQLPTISEHFDEAIRILHIHFRPDFEWSTAKGELGKMRSYLGRKQNPRWKDSTCPLIVIRPLVAPVTEPIEAASDDVAIFELLYSVGGRMPTA